MSLEYTTDLSLNFGKAPNGLIPVAVQDADTGELLIIAFTNKEAFDATRESGYATFYSRSRKTLWKKGETSGDYLKIKEIRVNCEQNSLLYLVEPMGEGACHAKKKDGTAHSGCFYRKISSADTLTFLEE